MTVWSFAHRLVSALACAVAGLAVLGCDPLGRADLVVATSWPADARQRVESEFEGWLGRNGEAGTVRIRWLILAPGDDLERLASRRDPPDVLLGGPAPLYERLASAGALAPLPFDSSPGWAVVQPGASRSTEAPDALLADPRNDPASLVRADERLAGKEFAEGYAELVRVAAGHRRIGRLGRAEPPGRQGVAIPAGGRHRELAIRFVRALEPEPIPASTSPSNSDVRELLADLLGATLVDAQDELWAAWAVLEQNGTPPVPLHWMTEPPPWPPASITRILSRQGETAMALVEGLAGQLTTRASTRAWLLSSWLSPPRPIDRDQLDAVAHAAGGRLFREPRFREWLRAEWTEWARQRYRRVARTVTNRPSSFPSQSSR